MSIKKELLDGMCSIGSYLATRLEQVGVKHHFAVAGTITSFCWTNFYSIKTFSKSIAVMSSIAPFPPTDMLARMVPRRAWSPSAWGL